MNNNSKKNKNNRRQSIPQSGGGGNQIIIILLLTMVVVMAIMYFQKSPQVKAEEWDYSTVVQKVKEGIVKEVTIVDQNIKAMREKALKTINELMDSDDDKVRYQASKDVLDRTGHLATMKKEVTITHKSFEEQTHWRLWTGWFRQILPRHWPSTL